MMDIDSKLPMAYLIALIFVVAYFVSRKEKKKAKEQEQANLAVHDPYQEIKSEITSYLQNRDYRFSMSDNVSRPQFKAHFVFENAPYQILITVINQERIDFAARVTSFPIEDNMLATVAEFTNRINTYSLDPQLNLNYENRHVEIHRSLITFYRASMFDWYFRCVKDGGRARRYLNQVLLEGENPALVALDYAHAISQYTI